MPTTELAKIEKTPMKELSILEVGNEKYRIKEDNLWIAKPVANSNGESLYTKTLNYIDQNGEEQTVNVAYCILYHHLMSEHPSGIVETGKKYQGCIKKDSAFKGPDNIPDVETDSEGNIIREFTNLKPEKFFGSHINVTFYHIDQLSDEDLNDNILAFVFYGDKEESARIVTTKLAITNLTHTSNLIKMSNYFNKNHFNTTTYSFHFYSRSGEASHPKNDISLLDNNNKINSTLGNWVIETPRLISIKNDSMEGTFKKIITEDGNQDLEKTNLFEINHANGSIYNINGFTSVTLAEMKAKLNKTNLSVKDLLIPSGSGNPTLSGRIRSGNINSATVDFSYNTNETYKFSNTNGHHIFFNGTHSTNDYNHGIIFTTPVATLNSNYVWSTSTNATKPKEFTNVQNNVNSLYYKKFSTYGSGPKEDQSKWIRILTDENLPSIKETAFTTTLNMYVNTNGMHTVFKNNGVVDDSKQRGSYWYCVNGIVYCTFRAYIQDKMWSEVYYMTINMPEKYLPLEETFIPCTLRGLTTRRSESGVIAIRQTGTSPKGVLQGSTSTTADTSVTFNAKIIKDYSYNKANQGAFLGDGGKDHYVAIYGSGSWPLRSLVPTV